MTTATKRSHWAAPAAPAGTSCRLRILPEVVVAEITHHGHSTVTNAPYEFRALGVIRVRDGEIIRYDDYMNPIALARLSGRTSELAAALSEV